MSKEDDRVRIGLSLAKRPRASRRRTQLSGKSIGGGGIVNVAAVSSAASLFARAVREDGDQDNDTKSRIERQRRAKEKAMERVMTTALQQDASVFDYDEVYDDMQQAKKAKIDAVAAKKRNKRSRYVSSLLEQAQRREREQDITYNKRILKERMKEDHMHEGKEKFVTGAYKKKMEEERKWLAEQEKREREEEKQGLSTRGLLSFRQHLIAQRVGQVSTQSAQVSSHTADKTLRPPDHGASSSSGRDSRRDSRRDDRRDGRRDSRRDSRRDNRRDRARSSVPGRGSRWDSERENPRGRDGGRDSERRRDSRGEADHVRGERARLAKKAREKQAEEDRRMLEKTKRRNDSIAIAAALERYRHRQAQRAVGIHTLPDEAIRIFGTP